jgi:hypothetical protein
VPLAVAINASGGNRDRSANLGAAAATMKLEWIVILSAIFLHLKKTPITDLTLTTSTYMPKISPYPEPGHARPGAWRVVDAIVDGKYQRSTRQRGLCLALGD